LTFGVSVQGCFVSLMDWKPLPCLLPNSCWIRLLVTLNSMKSAGKMRLLSSYSWASFISSLFELYQPWMTLKSVPLWPWPEASLCLITTVQAVTALVDTVDTHWQPWHCSWGKYTPHSWCKAVRMWSGFMINVNRFCLVLLLHQSHKFTDSKTKAHKSDDQSLASHR